MTDFIKYIAEHEGRKYTIEPEEFTDDHTQEKMIWYYVYAWTEKGAEYDHLQDTLVMAKECAFEEFGVPLNSWEKLNEDRHPHYGKAT